MFHRRHVRPGEKGGERVGKTKRGKGSKIMAIADRTGFPVALYVSSASPNEVTLVERTLETCFTAARPARLIGDKAYDSDPLDERLRAQGIELIAPHRTNRRKPKTQDGRALRRFKRRWKVERLNAWLLNARRVVVRYDRDLAHYYGFVRLAGIKMLMRRYF
jgi:transposase